MQGWFHRKIINEHLIASAVSTHTCRASKLLSFTCLILIHLPEIPKDWLERWECIVHREEIFHLPAPNDYIATDFSIKDPNLFTTPYPRAIVDTESGRLWFKKDNRFKVPKGENLSKRQLM